MANNVTSPALPGPPALPVPTVSTGTASPGVVISQSLPVPAASPGIADIIGFGVDGVIILRNSVNLQLVPVIKNFGLNAGNWQVDKHVRLLGDTTGDKSTDVVGFGEEGVWVSVNNGNNSFQDPPKLVLNKFGYNAGDWRIEKHLRFVADIRNKGYVDIIGFGDQGIWVSLNDGSGGFGPAQLALNDFGWNTTWRLDRHLRFLADVTGNGLLDVVGFGENHVYIGRNNGDGTFQPAQSISDSFCIGAGWLVDKHPRVVADLTGDGRADILGFGDTGVWVSLNDGSGSFGPANMVVDNLSVAQGWSVDKHVRLVADLTGNKRGDIIGFGDAGVWVSLNNGDGTFQEATLVVNDFGVQQGWQVGRHLRFVVDLTGDGCADIIGFGENAVLVAYNDGKGGFGAVQKLTDSIAFNGGTWALDKTVLWVTNLYT